MTREAFENAFVVKTEIGDRSNCLYILIAIAHHIGVALDLGDFDRTGYSFLFLLMSSQLAQNYMKTAIALG